MFEPSVESCWGQHLTYFEIASKWEAQPSVWLQWISLSMLVLECSLVPCGIKVRLGQHRLPRPWAVATMSVGKCWAMATVLAIDRPCSVPLTYLCTWQATCAWAVILSTCWKRWPPQDGKERLCSRADGAARARGLFVDFPLAMCGYKHRIMNTNEHWTWPVLPHFPALSPADPPIIASDHQQLSYGIRRINVWWRSKWFQFLKWWNANAGWLKRRHISIGYILWMNILNTWWYF